MQKRFHSLVHVQGYLLPSGSYAFGEYKAMFPPNHTPFAKMLQVQTNKLLVRHAEVSVRMMLLVMVVREMETVVVFLARH